MEKKFLFDVNIFDAPVQEVVEENLPPPPPTFSEDELAASKDMAFEQGRQKGQREQVESREQYVATSLEKIAQNFSKLFAAETVRESIFEKESLRLVISSLDLLYPSLNAKIGQDEVKKVVEQTLIDHRKTKEIVIKVPEGMKGEIEALIARLRASEHDEVLWRVSEDPTLTDGDCSLEWGDGGAVRDSVKTARSIRRNIEALLGDPQPALLDEPFDSDSEADPTDVRLKDNMEPADSVQTGETRPETDHE